MLTYALSLRKLALTAICLCWLLIGGGPNSVTQAQTRIYATDLCTSSLLVIDAATNTVLATIPVGEFPTSVAVTPDGTRVYVTARTARHVVVIDTATNTVLTHFTSSTP
jgi:YVTN family beta-propeller protein